jgi:hypothetical protein
MEAKGSGDFSGNGLPPRPGSALVRPGTATTRSVGLGQTAYNNESNSSSAVIRQQISGDSLLRILEEKQTTLANEALLFAETGNHAGIRSLLESGEDLVSIKGLRGYNLLHHACSRGHATVVNELLRVSFPTSSKTATGETPLHLAVYTGNLLIVEQLLDCGADIDACNDYHETALFYAARRSFPALVRMLTQRGADVTVEDTVGETAVEQAGNEHTRRAFDTTRIDNTSHPALSYDNLLLIFKYLGAKDVCRGACVSGKWHRVSENESIWSALKLRRWECALQSSLGFAPVATTSFVLRRTPSGSFKTKSPRAADSK